MVGDRERFYRPCLQAWSAGNYQRIAGAAASSATRDLADLVHKGALRKTGVRRHTRYRLDLPSFSAPGSTPP